MIVSFSVSNYRSFLSEQTFSFVASKRLSGQHKNHTVPIPDSDEKVLKIGVLYGANGAGKSNLFEALDYFRRGVLIARDKKSGSGREAFQLANVVEQPSSFDLQFIAGDKLFRFGFKVDDNRVLEEWLVRVVGKKEITIYERITSEDNKVTVEAPKFGKISKKLEALATVGGKHNQTFLATIHTTLEPAELGDDLVSVLSWFHSSLHLVAPDDPVAPIGAMLEDDKDFLEFASDFLKSSSTGVDHLVVEKLEITEKALRSVLPSGLASKIIDGQLDEDVANRVITLNGIDFLIEKADKNHYYQMSISAAHINSEGQSISFDIGDESDGTQRLLNLVPVLHRIRNENLVYFIDEIDRSMHPKLCWKFLEFFLSLCKEGQRQIVVTTHDTNLLDLDLLRRDEIWFAEKDAENATHLYSLSEFKIRKDLKIDKHYLEGRFGAIPYLGEFDRLIEEPN